MVKSTIPYAKLIDKLIRILPYMSEKSMIRALKVYQKFAKGESKKIIDQLIDTFENTQIGAYILRVAKATNVRTRRKIALTLIADGLIMKEAKRAASFKKELAVPATLLISPTMRCNLKCQGCYAANYSQQDDLPFNLADRIVTEAKELGVGFITLLGGEPFIWEHTLELIEKHPDMYFQIYTNGTLLTDKLARKLNKLGNVMPMLSIEGYEKETDSRRHPGVYRKVMQAMSVLKKNKVPFGFSVAVTKNNLEVVCSEKFIDHMIAQGALLGWYFLYMPVGCQPDLSLMPTPQQRLRMLDFANFIREHKPILTIDFWNDAPYVGGCIAGKFYAHINSEGWVEPCIFSHYAVDNIRDKSLSEVMNSDFFKALRAKQPYNDNLYLPCAWIDNPEVSRQVVKDFKLHFTHPGADDILVEQSLMQGIDQYAGQVKQVFNSRWQQDKDLFMGQDKIAKIKKKFVK